MGGRPGQDLPAEVLQRRHRRARLGQHPQPPGLATAACGSACRRWTGSGPPTSCPCTPRSGSTPERGALADVEAGAMSGLRGDVDQERVRADRGGGELLDPADHPTGAAAGRSAASSSSPTIVELRVGLASTSTRPALIATVSPLPNRALSPPASTTRAASRSNSGRSRCRCRSPRCRTPARSIASASHCRCTSCSR